MSSPSRPASHALMKPATSLRLIRRSKAFRRSLLFSIGERSKCGGIRGSRANDHLPFLTSYFSGTASSSRCPTAEDRTYSSLSKWSPLRVKPPSARAMSAATDGFSAMMSFLPMRRKAADDKCKRAPAQPPAGRGASALARDPRARRAEEILRHEAARRRLLIPHHHQHDELQLLQRQRLARCRERALDHQLARLRIEDSWVLERHDKTPALIVELRDRARREGAKRPLRVGQVGEAGVRRGQHPGEPVQRFADVGILEPGRGQLLRDAVGFVRDFGLLAVLEHVDEDVVHKRSLLINVSTGDWVYRRSPISRRWYRPPGSDATRPSSSSRRS